MASALALSNALYRLIATGMALDDLLLDTDHVHDRENPGLAIEGNLLLLVVRKQPAHAGVTAVSGRIRSGERRIDLARDQHVLERLILGDLRNVETGGGVNSTSSSSSLSHLIDLCGTP